MATRFARQQQHKLVCKQQLKWAHRGGVRRKDRVLTRRKAAGKRPAATRRAIGKIKKHTPYTLTAQRKRVNPRLKHQAKDSRTSLAELLTADPLAVSKQLIAEGKLPDQCGARCEVCKVGTLGPLQTRVSRPNSRPFNACTEDGCRRRVAFTRGTWADVPELSMPNIAAVAWCVCTRLSPGALSAGDCAIILKCSLRSAL